MYELTVENLKFLNSLYHAEYQNKGIYDILYQLELEGKTNSKKYKENLETIKKCLEDGKKFYKKNVEYVKSLYPIMYEAAATISVIEQQLLFPTEDISKLRVLDRTSNSIYNSQKQETNTESVESMEGLFMLNILCFKMLNKTIEKEKDEIVKEALIKMKYNNIYITQSVEENFINNELSTKKIVKKLLSCNDIDFFTTSISNIFDNTLNSIESYDEKEYNDKIKLAVIKYLFARIRAVLTIVPQQLLDVLYQDYEILLNEDKESNYLKYFINACKEANKIKQKINK